MEQLKIINTTPEDLSTVLEMFAKTIALPKKNGYKVWDHIDDAKLEQEIQHGLQFKILKANEIVCLFSIQYSDPFIWREKDQGNAIYVHRIIINQKLKGQKLFEIVLQWAEHLANCKKAKYIRMDTFADNNKLINYYKSFGFKFVENYRTSDSTELPSQNRNLTLALLELSL